MPRAHALPASCHANRTGSAPTNVRSWEYPRVDSGRDVHRGSGQPRHRREVDSVGNDQDRPILLEFVPIRLQRSKVETAIRRQQLAHCAAIRQGPTDLVHSPHSIWGWSRSNSALVVGVMARRPVTPEWKSFLRCSNRDCNPSNQTTPRFKESIECQLVERPSLLPTQLPSSGEVCVDQRIATRAHERFLRSQLPLLDLNQN